MRSDIRTSENSDHARRPDRTIDTNRANAGMCQGTTDEGDMQNAGEVNVGNKAATAQEQSPILAPRN
jgi:hypothetical protein